MSELIRELWRLEVHTNVLGRDGSGGNVTVDYREVPEPLCERIAAELGRLQGSLDRIYGCQFSDRVYHALKSRVERAEAACRDYEEDAKKRKIVADKEAAIARDVLAALRAASDELMLPTLSDLRRQIDSALMKAEGH